MMEKEFKKKQFTRPVAVIGFTYLITLMIASSFSVVLTAILSGIAILIALLACFVKPMNSPKLALISFVVGVALGCVSLYTHFNYEPVLKLDGQTKTVTGTVLDIEKTVDGDPVLTVRLDKATTGALLPTKTKLYFSVPMEARVADRITVNANFYLPSEEFGTYTPRQTSKADGIFILGSVQDPALHVTSVEGFHLNRSLYDFRQVLKEKSHLLVEGEECGVFQAMLLGNREELSDHIYRDFVRSGLVHLLVVSGLHLVVLSQFVIRTLKAVHVKRKPRYLIGMFVILFFMAVAGFQPSVNRAGFTLLLFYSAKLINRESDSLISLGCAGLIFTLLSPYLVLDIGFQLSYLSTLGILLFANKMKAAITARFSIKKTLLLWIIDMFCITVSVQLITLPLTACYFKGIPWTSPLANLLVSPLSTLILILGLIALSITFVPLMSAVAQVLAAGLTLLIRAVCAIASLFSSFPFGYLPMGYRFVYFWIIATIILFGFVCFKCNFHHRYSITAGLSAFVLIIAIITHTAAFHNTITLSVCTIGKSSAVMLQYNRRSIAFGVNSIVCSLADQTGQTKFPLVVADDQIDCAAELSRYSTIDTVITDQAIPPGKIKCRELRRPADYNINFDFLSSMKLRTIGKNSYYTLEIGNINIIYGSYDEHFENFYVDGKENIYILVNDCTPVFQKEVNYVIMLKNSNGVIQNKNPDVTFIDGALQGITPLYIGPGGEIKLKGADQWLY